MLVDPYPSQQHAGLNNAGKCLQQDVTRPKARFKPTSLKKSGVDISLTLVVDLLATKN